MTSQPEKYFSSSGIQRSAKTAAERAAAFGNAPELTFLVGREKYPETIKIAKLWVTAIRTLHHRYSARRDGDGRCQHTARTAERTVAEAFAGRERQQHLLQEAFMIDVLTGTGKPLRRPLLGAQKKIIHVYKLAGIYALQLCRKCRFAGTAAPVYRDDQTIFFDRHGVYALSYFEEDMFHFDVRPDAWCSDRIII